MFLNCGHTTSSLIHPSSLFSCGRRGSLDSTSPSRGTTPACAATGEAGDDDVEEGDDSADDGLEDSSDATDDGHDDSAYRLAERRDLKEGERC